MGDYEGDYICHVHIFLFCYIQMVSLILKSSKGDLFVHFLFSFPFVSPYIIFPHAYYIMTVLSAVSGMLIIALCSLHGDYDAHP